MLIKALCDYYDYQADKAPCTMPNGYAAQSVSYQVLLTENGEIAAINDYRKTITIQQKPKKNKDGSITELPDKTKKVPQEIGRSSHEERELKYINKILEEGAYSVVPRMRNVN